MIPHSRPYVGHDEIAAVARVVRSGWYVGGNETSRFRDALCEATGAEAAHLFASGREALSTALDVLDLPTGGNVVVQTYVCDAVSDAIKRAGQKPIYCDIGEHWTCTPQTVSAVINTDTVALVLAPPFGIFQSAEPFRRFGIPIIHDLCQASPSSLASRWQRVGNLVALSFHPTKYLGSAGGGAIVNCIEGGVNASLYEAERQMAERAPFGELEAAVGTVQMQRLAEFRARRQKLAEVYFQALPKSLTSRFRDAADVDAGNLFRFILRVSGLDFEQVAEEFSDCGVTVKRGVDRLAHRSFGACAATYPVAEKLFSETLSIPFYPALDDKAADQIIDSVHRIFGD